MNADEWCDQVDRQNEIATLKAEVERLRSGLSMAAMLDAGVPHALLMKDYRGAVLQMNEERHEVAKVARALLAAGEKAGGENV